MEPEIGLADHTLLEKASTRYLMRHNVLPFRIHDGVLSAIMADPFDQETLAELQRIYSVPVRPSCSTPAMISRALQSLDKYRKGQGSAYQGKIQYREIREDTEDDSTGEDTGADESQRPAYRTDAGPGPCQGQG